MGGSFKVSRITKLEDVLKDPTMTLPESDLCIQENGNIVQFEYVRGEDQKRVTIPPGVYNLTKGFGGLDVARTEFAQKELLTSVTNTASILREANIFFSKLAVYEELNQPKRRGVLLYSSPGQGKTSAIGKVVEDLTKQDAKTVVINWPTADIAASDVERFLEEFAEFDPSCSRLVLIIEDIGGGEREGGPSRHGVDSSLLNLLDGVNNVFKLPTFILATTNYPENLLSALADRPGRFDLLLKLSPPGYDERVALVEFIAKRKLTDLEKDSLDGTRNAGTENFSIAHLKEIVIRSRLHDKSIDEVIKELVSHTKNFKKDFQEKRKPGFGFEFD